MGGSGRGRSIDRGAVPGWQQTRGQYRLPVGGNSVAVGRRTQLTAALVGLGKREVSQDAAQAVLKHRVVLQRALQGTRNEGGEMLSWVNGGGALCWQRALQAGWRRGLAVCEGWLM